MNEKYEAVIGLEVHAQLLTKTKLFCSCSTKFGNPPNTNVCPVCLGHPGVLPVLNKKAVEFAIKIGLATNCQINRKSVFARKNYFYPDLPKGYQISQFEKPICENGNIDIETAENEKKTIRLNRIHLEEDAGKLIHDQSAFTLVDLNRSGTPLIEIVSEPDLRSASEAYDYLSNLKMILTYLEICDGNMEEGSLRCDANISIRPSGSTELGTRTEIKNMNSFRNVERAIEFEINRQIEAVEYGEKIIQETLLWDADLNSAKSMRGKEDSHDYRYFPDPDLPSIIVSDSWINEIKSTMPELHYKKLKRFVNDLNLPVYDSKILTSEKPIADYFENVIKHTSDFKSASNWVMGEVLKTLKETNSKISDFNISPVNLAKLINLINGSTISGTVAKDVFQIMLEKDEDPEVIVKDRNLSQISDTSELRTMIVQIINNNPTQAEQYKSGKTNVLGFFVGMVMRESKGKANPKIVSEILAEELMK